MCIRHSPNLYLNVGHGARGGTTSFASARLLSDLLQTGHVTKAMPSNPDASYFKPSRFQIWDIKWKWLIDLHEMKDSDWLIDLKLVFDGVFNESKSLFFTAIVLVETKTYNSKTNK